MAISRALTVVRYQWLAGCVLVFGCVSAYRPYPDPGPDIAERRYCTVRRPQQCCPGRDDYCTVPILDTVCYCDHFCNRTVADCCPDFWNFCLGVRPPPGAQTPPPSLGIKNNCNYQGSLFMPGDVIAINCNNCTCVDAVLKQEYNWKCTQKICLVREELLQHVNSGHFGWRAANHSMMWGLTLDDGVKYRLGTLRPGTPVKQMTSLRVHIRDVLPASLDARKEWPGLVHPVMDQGNCGASWAFSTTSVAADRLAIHSHGSIKETLSPQHLLSCDGEEGQKGCDGGHIDRAWWFMRKVGVVTDACYPYKSGLTNSVAKCLIPRYFQPPTRIKCPPGGADKSHVFQATPPYRIAPNEREIMKEIMDNGPVQATMEVKEDFYMYKGGVYRYSMPAVSLPPNHPRTGFHSVRMVGWGVDHSQERPLKYWICANSWGDKWGEDGFFRIARGVDECKIESFVVGVWGKVSGRQIVNSRRHGGNRYTARRQGRRRRRHNPNGPHQAQEKTVYSSS